METENHQDKHIKGNSQDSDDKDIHGLTGDEPLQDILIRTLSAVSTVLVIVYSSGGEVCDTEENIKQRQLVTLKIIKQFVTLENSHTCEGEWHSHGHKGKQQVKCPKLE